MNRRVFSCVALLVLLAGCGDVIDGKGIAEPEVARFHELLNARDFDGIYNNADADFQSSSPKEKVLALFTAIDRKLGALQETKQVNWNVNTQNLITTVVLVYSSRFKEGEATETFTFRVRDGKAELVGYNISSLDMLIK